MDPIDVKVGGQSVLEISGDGTRRPTTLAIECTPGRQAASADVYLEILGARASAKIDVRDTDRATIALGVGDKSIYASSAVTLSDAKLATTGEAAFSYVFKVGSSNCRVSMSASVAAMVDAAKAVLSQSVTFVAHVGNVTIPLQVSGGTVPLTWQPQVERFFRETLASGTSAALAFMKRVADEYARSLVGGWVDAAEAFILSVGPQIFSGMSRYSGAAASAVAQWTVTVFGVSPEQAVGYLGLDPDEAIGLLVETFGRGESEARRLYEDVVGPIDDWAEDVGNAFGRMFG